MTTSWIKVPFHIDTPMFLGGASGVCDPDAQFIPSLRGALRFWFRALVGPAYGENTEGLARAEATFFGWAAEDGEEWGSSPIRLRLQSQLATVDVQKRPDDLRLITDEYVRSKPGFKSTPDWVANRGQDPHGFFGITYLLGQGLWHRRCGLMRGYVQIGEGALEVSCPDELREVLCCSLWALARFGGLGSRSRKGFGSISFDSAPAGFGLIRVPRGHTWNAMAHRAQASVMALTESVPVDRPWILAELPAYPQFVEGQFMVPKIDDPYDHDFVDVGGCYETATGWDSWHQALGGMGERWRRLRTELNSPTNKTYVPLVETPEWRQVILTAGSDDFGVGALGLPIVYGHQDPPVHVNLLQPGKGDGDGDKELRLPSPIRFRPRRNAEGRYTVDVLSLACRSVPEGAVLRESKHGRTLELGDELTMRRISCAMKALNKPAIWTDKEWPAGAG